MHVLSANAGKSGAMVASRAGNALAVGRRSHVITISTGKGLFLQESMVGI